MSEGEILGLIGPNGAGKTTLCNVIDGVYAPSEGKVIFRGEDVTGLPSYEIARRGLVRAHQVVRPLSELTVRENVMVGACFGRECRSLASASEVADEALAKVGLTDRASQPAGSLNVAQKKRLEMARALAAHPYLVLLDEVLAGLNPAEIAAMIETVRAVRDEGVSILMIEHVMQAIMSVSDQLIVLDYGMLIASGLPGIVANDPKVIKAYLGDPQMTARLMGEED